MRVSSWPRPDNSSEHPNESSRYVDTIGAMVEEGKPAPDFTLPADEGEDVSLSSFRGQPVVLYFCPKDEWLGDY